MYVISIVIVSVTKLASGEESRLYTVPKNTILPPEMLSNFARASFRFENGFANEPSEEPLNDCLTYIWDPIDKHYTGKITAEGR